RNVRAFLLSESNNAISKAADSPAYQNSACWESKPRLPPYTKPQQKCWGFFTSVVSSKQCWEN
ncbi:hypothetical protein, partial [Vibrio lentus]